MRTMPDDATLLRRYTEDRSEAAFAELVRWHLDRVYSTAVRRVGNDAHLAEDVTQTVFVALARRAAALARHPHLSGWLYLTTRNAAANVVRHERRRKARELEAQAMQDISSPVASEPDWSRVAPILDAAIDELSASDRTAVLLRFVDRCAFADIGTRLRLTEDAARRRVDRSLDKLRERLARRGITSSSAALGLALANHAVVAAPASLAATVTGTAMAAAPALGASTIELLHIMTATKLAGSIAAVALLIVALGTATYEMRGRHAAEAALAAAGQDYAARAAKLHDLERRTYAAERDATQLKKNVDDARATRATSAAAAARTPGLYPEGRAFLARHPEVKQALIESSNASLNYKWAALYQSLRFTPAQIEQFQVLMRANRAIAPSLGSDGKILFLPTGDDMSTGKVDSRLRDLLGDDGLRKCQEFGLLIPARELTAQVAGALCFTVTPLTAEQSAQLVQIIARSQSNASVSQAGTYDWDAVVAKAQGLLSAPQLVALANARAQAAEQTQSLKSILHPIPAPGALPPICP